MTRSPRFRACLAEVLKWEGGFSDDPFDPGGPTNKGITIGVYAGFVGALGVALEIGANGRVKALDQWAYYQLVDELRTIPDDLVAEIYHRNYWLPVTGDELPVGIDLAVFDFAVNSGPPRAIRHLQKVLGVGIDGHMGAITLAAAHRADPAAVIPKLMDSRRTFLRQIKHFWRFGKGWMRRVDGVQGNALALVPAVTFKSTTTAPPPLPAWSTVVTPLPDPDAQSATQGRAMVSDSAGMAQSKTGRAAETIGGLGSVQLGVEVSSAAARARVPGGFDALGFALSLAQSPSFWVAASIVGGAAYVWLERQRKARLG